MMGELKGWFQRLRRVMLEEREREVQILQKIQSHRTPLFDWYFWLASNFGEELFYITFLPLSAWVLGLREAAHFVVLMLFFCVGVGNWLKNVFLIPRPPHPRVWTPEGVQKTDHGFPSTHTISFVAAPLYFLVYQYHDKFYRVQQYPVSLPVATVLIFVIAGSVIFSRLYNGYHSPLDVAGGSVIGLLFLGLWYTSWRHWFDQYLMWTSVYAPLVTFAVGACMVIFHPRPPEPTAALPESGMLFGAATGTVIAVQLSNIYDIQAFLGPPPDTLFSFLRESVLHVQTTRFLLGMVIVAVVRSVCKLLFTSIVKRFYPDAKDANWVTAVVKFLNYMMISFAITFWIQMIFHKLGIHTDHDLRPTSAFPTGFPK
jgi:membrane-associated phospholipid phosphatase